MPFIKTGFARETDALFELTTKNIHLQLDINAVIFPDPTPSLGTYGDSIDVFSDLRTKAIDGSKADRIARNDARKVLYAHTKTLAEYVSFIANGDALKLAKSGFEVSRPPQPVLPIGVPQGLKIKAGLNTGEFTLSVKAVKNAKTYLFQYTEEPLTELSNWTSAISTRSRNTITGLTPGKKYWFRVAAAGVRDQLTYSVVIALICQ